jgi:hydroxymethylbilane synthase
MARRLKIGTRGSKLALWQANWVKRALETAFPDEAVELVIIKTRGDKITDVPLAQVGGSALFVKELEEALRDGRIDIAVHSMKDMPSAIAQGLRIGAVPKRETPRDILISRGKLTFDRLPQGAKIGTSSLRRQSQLLSARPDLTMVPLRGNLDTRIKKLDTEDLDAIVVAAAGVKRLDFDDRITEYLDDALMLPAVGQGALCIEIRKDDGEAARRTAPLDHPETHTAVRAERAFLRRLGGSCQVPMAALATLEKDVLTMDGLVASLDGTRIAKDRITGPAKDPEHLGDELAGRLIHQGADRILKDILSELPCHDQR